MDNLRTAPIGVFDSGVGGISVLKKLTAELPGENFIYFGDCAYAPYGCKSEEEVRARAKAVAAHLKSKGVKALVIACNTATSASAQTLRDEDPSFIIVGMEPAIKPAAHAGKHPRVLIMATEMTLRLEKFNHLKEELSSEASFETLPCPDLVKLVESGRSDGAETAEYLKKQLAPYLSSPPDCIVLGCTHFPFARRQILSLFDPPPLIFDGIDGTAKRLMARLEEEDLLARRGKKGTLCFESSDGDPRSIARMRALFETKI